MNDTVSYNGQNIPVQFGGAYAPGVAAYFANGLGTAGNPLSISGSFSANLGGFAPGGAYASLSVSTSSANVALPAGTTVVVYNTGANPAYVKLGSSSVAAATGNDVVAAGGALSLTVGSNAYLAAITASGATALNVSGGSGLPTGWGGGSGGGANSPPVGSGSLAASQASIGTSATSIVAARTGAAGTGRIAATLYNSGSATVYVGASGVTTSTGMPLPAGASITLNTTAAIYGVAASGTQTIGVTETY